MASEARGGRSLAEAEDSEEVSPDERLDFFSDKFDPVLALRTPGLIPPVPEAKTYDNIYMFQSANAKRPPKPNDGKQTESARRKQVAALAHVQFERNFQPHQMPIQTQRRSFTNVLTRMDNIQGPLSILKKCRDERLRIKVWTRFAQGLRGYCLAYLTCFDKYWNMTLQDVTEIWTRPKKRKVPALATKLDEIKKEKLQGVFPAVKIISEDKKTETCQRSVNELLVRGEQVAFIVILQGQE